MADAKGNERETKPGFSVSVSELVQSEEKSIARNGFADDHALPPPPVLSEKEAALLYRKIDLRLMPMLTIMYLCSFLDRGK